MAIVLACALLLLVAQLMVFAHFHDHEHGHGEGGEEPVCAVCLHKATGQEQIGPLHTSAAAKLPPRQHSALPAAPAPAVTPQDAYTRHQARGPPPASRTA